jgi:hypothetical protein
MRGQSLTLGSVAQYIERAIADFAREPNGGLIERGHSIRYRQMFAFEWTRLFAARMSAYGPKQTSASALHMSAFWSKADMGCCSANVCFNPKRT